NATYQDDALDLLSPAGPEYFFNAILNGGNTIRSADPLLKVNQVIDPNIVKADVNNDGIVDSQDAEQVLGAWLSTSGPQDINGDGKVNSLDFASVYKNSGKITGAAKCT